MKVLEILRLYEMEQFINALVKKRDIKMKNLEELLPKKESYGL
jgi:hypothetical protein